MKHALCIIALLFSTATAFAQRKPQPAGTPVFTTTGPDKPTGNNKIPAGILNFDVCKSQKLTLNDGVLKPLQGFVSGSIMWSPNKLYHLEFESSGELAVFDNVKLDGAYAHAIWKAGIANQGGVCSYLAQTGSFQVVDANRHNVFITQDFSKPFPVNGQPAGQQAKDALLYLENDGSLVIRSASTGQTVSIYKGSDQNKKPAPKDLSMGIPWWDAGTSFKVGTVIGPGQKGNGTKNVLVCDKTGLLLRADDQNEVSFPRYVSKKFNGDVTACTFESDGDLTVTTQSSGVWHLGTTGLHGTRVRINDAGNAEMINTKTTPLFVAWDSQNGLNRKNPYINKLYSPDYLVRKNGHAMYSPNGNFTLVLQTDGNLVLYRITGGEHTALWSTQTNGNNDVKNVVMQTDGNLVMYGNSGAAIWNSHTSGHPKAYLSLQDDGNLVIYESGTIPSPLWSTKTSSN